MSDDRLLEAVADLEDRLEDVRMELEDERERTDRLEDELEDERDRRRDLEDELASERRRRRRLERAVAENDQRARDWRDEHEVRHEAASNWNENIEDRVAALEDRAVDAEDVIDADPTEDLLPIQQLYNTVKNGGADSMNANQERAARVWPHFRDYSDPSNGTLTLTSTKVRDILERELEIDRPNPNTVRRVMEFLERFSGADSDERIIRLDDSTETNRLVCDREDWLEATGQMMDAARRNGADRAMTDGGPE